MVFSNEDHFFLDSTMLLTFNRLRSFLRAIENINGPIRQYIPKETNLKGISKAMVTHNGEIKQ